MTPVRIEISLSLHLNFPLKFVEGTTRQHRNQKWSGRRGTSSKALTAHGSASSTGYGKIRCLKHTGTSLNKWVFDMFSEVHTPELVRKVPQFNEVYLQ